MRVETRVLNANTHGIAEAAACLRAGGLVAFPTETVYGLGADATNGDAVARLYAAKGRPHFNPLIAHVENAEAAHRLAIFNADAEALAARFWPGPLTLVLPMQTDYPVTPLAAAGLDTIAVRVPAHQVARDLLRAAGVPIVAPSANRSGHVSPTAPTHVLDDLDGRIDMLLAAGAVEVGVESTIVACTGNAPMLLRPGGLPTAAIEAALGRPLMQPTHATTDAPIAPGQLAAHYAPANAKLRLAATSVAPGEGLIAFGTPLPCADGVAPIYNLSPSGDLNEAARNLFVCLRDIEHWHRTIAVMPIPEEGLGAAINDRLTRAAAGT